LLTKTNQPMPIVKWLGR